MAREVMFTTIIGITIVLLLLILAAYLLFSSKISIADALESFTKVVIPG